MKAHRTATVLLVAACGCGPRWPDADPPGVTAPDVDPAAPGPVEMPGVPLSEPFPWRTATAAAAAVVVASALVARRRRPAARDAAATQPAASSVPGTSPQDVALARLARLRGRPPRTPDDHVETAAILREFVGERFGVRAGQRTTEELAASPGVAAAARLADVLGRCDLVKFACHEPPPTERAALLDDAEAYVREAAAP